MKRNHSAMEPDNTNTVCMPDVKCQKTECKANDCTNGTGGSQQQQQPPTENNAGKAIDISKLNRNQNQNKNKKGQPPTKGSRIEKLPSYYFFLNRHRYIAPYKFEYRCFAKGRWFERSIYEVMTTEFVAYDAAYYKRAIESGKILVRNEKVDLSYVIKNGDWIAHFIHRHEPPVLHREIEIVHEDNDIMVVNKPSGVAIHPCGKYRYNTLIYILYNEWEKELYCAHRLDRVTSGLLLLCKTKKMAQTLGKKIRDRSMKKTYVARVKGRFPRKQQQLQQPQTDTDTDEHKNENENESESDNEAELITVQQAIGCIDQQKGVHCIDEKEGKEAETQFRFLKYNAKDDSSLVYCHPKTGRTHQIRLHLQYLGHSICNDFAYGGEEHPHRHWIPSAEQEKRELLEDLNKHYDEQCDECQTIVKEINGETSNIRNSAPQIWLHALKYECDEFSHSVPMPDWAQ